MDGRSALQMTDALLAALYQKIWKSVAVNFELQDEQSEC